MRVTTRERSRDSFACDSSQTHLRAGLRRSRSHLYIGKAYQENHLQWKQHEGEDGTWVTDVLKFVVSCLHLHQEKIIVQAEPEIRLRATPAKLIFKRVYEKAVAICTVYRKRTQRKSLTMTAALGEDGIWVTDVLKFAVSCLHLHQDKITVHVQAGWRRSHNHLYIVSPHIQDQLESKQHQRKMTCEWRVLSNNELFASSWRRKPTCQRNREIRLRTTPHKLIFSHQWAYQQKPNKC